MMCLAREMPELYTCGCCLSYSVIAAHHVDIVGAL